HGAHCR
ncbi:toxin CbtA, partial [Escherichia coli 3.4870]